MGALLAKDLTVLLADVRGLIVQSREGVARAVDAGLTTLYWHVGQRVRQDILKEKRAEYGERIVSALSSQLEREFGRGFGRRNLFRMVRFVEVFPDPKIVSALRTQLGWTHFRQIIALDVESVQTSCGFSVPLMAFQEDRETLKTWARKKGDDGLRAYWLEKNAQTIDGHPTGMAEVLEAAE